MPLVMVTSKSSFDDLNYLYLAKEIPKIIVGEIDLDTGVLSEKDVSVRFSVAGPHDVMIRDVEVLVLLDVDDCGPVKQNDELAKRIARRIHEATPHGIPNIWVWLRFTKLGFFQTP